MKKSFFLMVFSIIAATVLNAQTLRVLAECTVTYSVTAKDDAVTNAENAKSLNSIAKTVYIKGNQSRVDVISPTFSQSVIFDKATNNAVVLRDIGNNKYMTKLDNAKWKLQNSRYEGATLTITADTKTILGYECKKATLKLKDSSSFVIYYAANIVPSVKEFEYQFKDVPGFVLEYESQDNGGEKVKYTATKINLNPVSPSKFEIPTNGYRILN